MWKEKKAMRKNGNLLLIDIINAKAVSLPRFQAKTTKPGKFNSYTDIIEPEKRYATLTGKRVMRRVMGGY